MFQGPLHSLRGSASGVSRASALDALERVALRSLATGDHGSGSGDGDRRVWVRELRAACAAALTADAEPADVVRVLCGAVRTTAAAHPKGTWMTACSRPVDAVDFVVRTVWQHSDEGLRERLLADVGAVNDNLARAVQACALTLADEAFSHGGFFGRGVPCMLR